LGGDGERRGEKNKSLLHSPNPKTIKTVSKEGELRGGVPGFLVEKKKEREKEKKRSFNTQESPRMRDSNLRDLIRAEEKKKRETAITRNRD